MMYLCVCVVRVCAILSVHLRAHDDVCGWRVRTLALVLHPVLYVAPQKYMCTK